MIGSVIAVSLAGGACGAPQATPPPTPVPMVPATTMESITVAPLPTNVEPEPTPPPSEPAMADDDPATSSMQVGDVEVTVPTSEMIDPMLSMPYAP